LPIHSVPLNMYSVHCCTEYILWYY
jgi:hypothetical protein